MIINRLRKPAYVLTHLLAPFLAFVISSQVTYAKKADELFRSDEVLKITLTSAFKKINSERDKSATYTDSTLSYVDDKGDVVSIDIDIQVRGNFRLQRDVCKFPPLRLLIENKTSKNTLFTKQEKLKLVTTCKPGSAKFEQYLVREYLAYKIFNALTDNSFKVRLAEVNYTYSDSKNRSETHLGFFIETKKRMAKRLDRDKVDLNRVHPSEHDVKQLNLVSLFQFMIGNTDWSALEGEPNEGCCHNAKLVQSENVDYLAIPYDFDFSGLVNARYAYPNPKFRLRSVRQRYYRGFCEEDEVVQGNLSLLREKKAIIYEIIENQAQLTAKSRKADIRYLDDFYETIDDPKKLKKHILDKCRHYSRNGPG
jgi:hypothetical protein